MVQISLPKTLTMLAIAIGAFAIVHSSLAADFNFFGRTGDAIDLNFGSLPGVTPGSTFSGLNTIGSSATFLTSDTLTTQPFTSTGRLWVFPSPIGGRASGDTNGNAQGFQGTLTGSLLINGVTKTFSVTVQPGYTGSGAGAVGQASERLGDATNNPLFVAEQQQRLRYFGYVAQGGGAVPVTGIFDAPTDQALRTFQADFIGGINTTQANADGIIGPNTAGWLNAANAPQWVELIDPDPQPPGTFTIPHMIGNFDIYPGPDPGTGARTGNTPQPERWAVSWTVDLIQKGSALAKAATGRTQRINAISKSDGYGSSCCHSTHLVGTDIDLGTDSSTWNYGNGTLSTEENIVAQHALAFVHANATGRVIRFITSNQDIYDAIHAGSPSTALYYDTSGDHQNHLHIDVGPPTQIAGLANLPGDFNFDDDVDAKDYIVWRDNAGKTLTTSSYNTWRANFGKSVVGRASGSADISSGLTSQPIPEPSAALLILSSLAGLALPRRR